MNLPRFFSPKDKNSSGEAIQTNLVAYQRIASVLTEWSVGFAQSIGKLREHNEDALFSLVQEPIDTSSITQEEAAIHPQRNVLTIALRQWEQIEPLVGIYTLPAAGHIHICSDGL